MKKNRFLFVLVSQSKFNKKDAYEVGKSNSMEIIEEMRNRLPKQRGRKYVVKMPAKKEVGV